MNKSIQVIITSVLLIAAFFTAALSFDACTGKKKTVDDKVNEALDQVDDEFFESDSDSDDTYETDESATTDFSQDDSESVDYSSAEDKAGSTEDVVEESNTYEETTTYTNISSSGSQYLVVAGNFLVESNAKKMVKKLTGLGYNSSEVAIFEYSQYYTVIASRASDYGTANSIAKSLKNDGVDCYVHTKK